MDRGRAIRAVASVVILVGFCSAVSWAQGLALSLQTLASGFRKPVAIVDPLDGTSRLFIVEQGGLIKIWDGSQVLGTPFLDLSLQVGSGSERGVLGLAFHPDYETNGYFYVNYTDLSDDTVISRFSVSAGDPDVADSASELELLGYVQPGSNHNGGTLVFGKDGFLYIASGDGGPSGNGQATGTLLGKILRIDVDDQDPGLEYAIPPDNPFVMDPATRDEIWALGLRNPWKISFDRETHDLYIGDVGEGSLDEIDFQPAASTGGENYGWQVMEGTSCNDPPIGCDMTGLTLPVLEYSHSEGCSVTAGHVYRGSVYPQLDGVFVYGDYCFGTIWGSVPSCGGGWTSQQLLASGLNIASFGEDRAGELYVAEHSFGGSTSVYRLALAAGSGGPVAVSAPVAADFGNVLLNTLVSGEITITNTNAGPEAVLVEGMVVSDPSRFTLDLGAGATPCGTTAPCLAPGESCTLEIDFSSASQGFFEESLTIQGNFVSLEVPLDATAYTPCPHDPTVEVMGMTLSGFHQFSACDQITMGPALTLGPKSMVTAEAGDSVVFTDGFVAEEGATLTVAIDPLLAIE